MTSSTGRFLFDLPCRYRIRVQGALSASWPNRLEDMTVNVRQAAGQLQVTTLTGEMRDQAALMGVLSMLYDMGFPLLKVERLEPAEPSAATQGAPAAPDQPTESKS